MRAHLDDSVPGQPRRRVQAQPLRRASCVFNPPSWTRPDSVQSSRPLFYIHKSLSFFSLWKPKDLEGAFSARAPPQG